MHINTYLIKHVNLTWSVDLRHIGECLQTLKGYQKFRLCKKKKKLFFDRFLTFNSLTPMSEELLSPEIIGKMALCYYLSRNFVQETTMHHHKKPPT